MSPRAKVIVHSSMWVFALCGALVSPMILIFILPLVIGVGADLVQACGEPIVLVLVAGAAARLVLGKVPGALG